MTKNEKLDKLAALSNELDELRKVIESENDNVWLQYGNKYYSISTDGSVNKCPDTWMNNELDAALATIGNVFRTYDEAKFASERLKVLAEMQRYAFRPDWKDRSQEKWYIVATDGCSLISPYSDTVSIGVPVFQSRATAERCIEAIGEDRLLKYWFGVEK